jgi:hypothetical protein
MFSEEKYSDLQQYFDYLIKEESIRNADLHSIILTGLSPMSIDLFQAFIDKTNDIQSVTLAIVHSPYLDVLNSKQIEYWITCYREQLNRLKYWERRAEFDILKMKLAKSQTILLYSNTTNSPTQTENNNNNNLLMESSNSLPKINKPNNAHSSSNFLSYTNNSSRPTLMVNSASISSHLLTSGGGNQKVSQKQAAQNQVQVHLVCNKCGTNVSFRSQTHSNSDSKFRK